ncbi:uncharacterized protein PODANS_2_1820 [Podospora anserina S mat+]|uniref:Podospora anserina S mat+ genomic DNA chromosome 2, supercontig 2 n=1 Tax=Podospora anserina (strain S / ATCC MYA-4624 / DSM 980 / FGSC 10383) TaxID=515849 RepID=B2B4M8_PODAN|nr:uncharacterized protein PODANS_2_1820 [Podospora anserina S mat+]CAP72753.1 unnamed protein product [Podospora anserina S mat+]CDP25149.1 Putative protein similar to UCP3_SCHPO of Schizosaccharomyces pombe [Podospora anserina S mat+]
MSGAMSKRQAARNEKVLQELVQTVPGNNFCADCSARNPSWASWSLGIFLCMRCATLHRKMGTHVSKVKSLSMDSWTNEQVDNMKKVGNVVSNKIYNPDNKKPSIPVDVEEADSVMERYIRSKYMNRTLAAAKKHHTGSSEDTPPPLPPKTPSRFGLRSASSIFPLGSKKKSSPGREPTSPRDDRSHPPLRNKGSAVFGVSFSAEPDKVEDTEQKLTKLRDMGFTDESRNAMVLKGVGGNLEKAIEALVRLGEGSGRAPGGLLQPVRTSSMPLGRNLTTGTPTSARPISPASTNPFDMLDTPPPPQPLSSQSTGTLQNKNPYLPTNPFGAPQQAQPAPSAFDLAFQNLSLAPPQQPLFPNHTGGLLPQQQQQQVQQTQAIYQQQPMTAPLGGPFIGMVSPGEQPYGQVGVYGSQTYPQPQPLQPQSTGYNPFFQNQQPQQQPLSVNTTGFNGNYGNNPFTKSPTRLQSPMLSQIPEQTQQNFYATQPQQQLQQSNPFFSQQPNALQQPQQQQQQQQQQYGQLSPMLQVPQQQVPQQMGLPPQVTGYFAQHQPQQQQQQLTYQQQMPVQQQRPDKASILALYGQQPQVSANPYGAPQDIAQATPVQTPNSLYPPSQQPQQQQAVPTPVSPAATGSKNPFVMSMGGAAAPAAAAAAPQQEPKLHNVSRESMMAVGLEWTNGRHSPDAFSGLSARGR